MRVGQLSASVGVCADGLTPRSLSAEASAARRQTGTTTLDFTKEKAESGAVEFYLAA
jgi:hypothetical protein